MEDRRANWVIAGTSTLLVALCCVVPPLVIAFGIISFATWISSTTFVLVPVLLIVLGVGGIWLFRHRFVGPVRCPPTTLDSKDHHD